MFSLSKYSFCRPTSAFADSVHLRVRIALEDLLLNQFSQPRATLERQIIQSGKFRRSVLAKWADYCIEPKRTFSGDAVQELISLCPVSSLHPEISWILGRIETPKSLQDATSTVFPSTLARTGPQFPFSPQEFDHLSRKLGSITGEEMTRPIVVQRNIQGMARRAKKDSDLRKYEWELCDDEDKFEEDLLNPKSVSIFPSF